MFPLDKSSANVCLLVHLMRCQSDADAHALPYASDASFLSAQGERANPLQCLQGNVENVAF